VPDGKNLRFTPTRDGMQVTVGGNNQQTQHFAEGGEVQDDFQYETAGSQTPSGSDYDRAAQASAAQELTPEERRENLKSSVGGAIDAFTPKRDENNATQNFFLKIRDILPWVKKNQFDKVMETGPEAQAAAMGQPPQESEGSLRPGQVADQSRTSPPPPRGAVDMNSDYQQGVTNDTNARQADYEAQVAKAKPKDVGAKIGTEAARDPESTLKEILHNVDQMYPFVGQNTERLAARNAALNAWMTNRQKVEAEQTKGEHADNRARIGADARKYGSDQQLTGRVIHEGAATDRTHETNQTRQAMGAAHDDRVDERTQFSEGNKNYRSNVITNVGASNEDSMARAKAATPQLQHRQPQQQGGPAAGPAAGPRPALQQAPQLPPAAMASLKEGQHTTFKNGQVWTLRGGQPVQVQ
jgi:hypothetical protein